MIDFGGEEGGRDFAWRGARQHGLGRQATADMDGPQRRARAPGGA